MSPSSVSVFARHPNNINTCFYPNNYAITTMENTPVSMAYIFMMKLVFVQCGVLPHPAFQLFDQLHECNASLTLWLIYGEWAYTCSSP